MAARQSCWFATTLLTGRVMETFKLTALKERRCVPEMGNGESADKSVVPIMSFESSPFASERT